jgi:acyl-CoA synthetase (AMP-forming)/AMP-acid ligase II
LAEILHRNGVGPGSFVAVFMTNSPEMVFTILALAKLGAVPALINIALRSKSSQKKGIEQTTNIHVRPNTTPLFKRCRCFNYGSFSRPD